MKVTPVNRKFGKYSPGEEFELPDKTAKIFIKVGKLQAANGYQTRMMQAEPVSVVAEIEPVEKQEDAPYGYKTDGTPRKRPGRSAASE